MNTNNIEKKIPEKKVQEWLSGVSSEPMSVIIEANVPLVKKQFQNTPRKQIYRPAILFPEPNATREVMNKLGKELQTLGIGFRPNRCLQLFRC